MTRHERLLKKAWEGMGLLQESLTYDDIVGVAEGADVVDMGLRAVAVALADLENLDSRGESLDAVLAELEAPEELVEGTAKLVETVGRAGYMGLGRESVTEAETLREAVVEYLDELLTRLEETDP